MDKALYFYYFNHLPAGLQFFDQQAGPTDRKLVPLTPAYIPPSCQNTALATIPAATALAQPTPELKPTPRYPPRSRSASSRKPWL